MNSDFSNNSPEPSGYQLPVGLIPPRQRGRTLASFTKNEGLSAAEECLLRAVVRGEPCIIGEGTRPAMVTTQNRVRGSFLRYLVLGGCSEVSVHHRGVHLQGAYIVCGTTAYGPGIDMEGIETDLDVYCNDCTFDGGIYLIGAKLRTLGLKGSRIKLLELNRATLDGSLILRNGFDVSGDLFLSGARISNSLDLQRSHVGGQIEASNLTVGSSVKMSDDFVCDGTVYLPNTTIGGNLDCSRALFLNKEYALSANRADIRGDVLLSGVNTIGPMAFQSTQVGGNFSAQGASFSGKNSLEMRGCQIKGMFTWREVAHAPGRLDLGSASVHNINMDLKSWLKPSQIKLNNFTYNYFSELEPGTNSQSWKAWLTQQPDNDLTIKFRPKPWEQLAGILDSMGYAAEARAIRIEKERRTTDFLRFYDPDRKLNNGNGYGFGNIIHSLNVFWRRVFVGPVIQYGYQPGLAIIWLLALIAIGGLVYGNAAYSGIMTPTHPLIYKEAEGGLIPKRCADNWVYFPEDIAASCASAVPSEYSEFQSLIYAADIALPVVNLRMEADWSPRVVHPDGSRDWHGWWVRTFEWVSIVIGWILSLLFVSAIGGIIRR